MWLLNRLAPDHKSIAEFRRMHSEAVTQVGAELIHSLGLVRGEWVALDGSKFRAVSSVGSVREREAVKRYLESLESADQDEGAQQGRRSSEETAGAQRTGSTLHARHQWRQSARLQCAGSCR